MVKFFKRFKDEDSGATTVDWVLLTAGLMSLTLAVMGSYGSGAKGISETVSSAVGERPTTINW